MVNKTGSDFQSLILKLHAYWAQKGCVILQPYDMEVGAGTFDFARFGAGTLESGLCSAVAASR